MAAATVQVNVRIDPTLYEQLKRRARRDKLTVTASVNAAITDYVKGKQ